MRLRLTAGVLGFAVAATLAACAPNTASNVASNGAIQTDSGLVAGTVLSSGVRAWLGIPYAKAPVGERRWRAPEPNQWEGVYNADRKMAQCIQILRPRDINHFFGEEPTSEDCLFMNIWSPADATPASALPVIVFIYGGGSTVGSSGMALYGGEEVARRGAVYVNFNYRVGILGFMAHPELTKETGRNASGNWAYLDQVAALRWIQGNIAQFGGDPAKVVISGQSAGAGAVSLLEASPLAAGLFRGVVAMSGGTWGQGGQGGPSLADGEQIGLRVQELLGADSLDAMRQVPPDRLLALQSENQLGATGGGPIRAPGIVDGYYLPDTPANLFASGRSNDVPVIAGFANDESNSGLRSARTAAEYEAIARRALGADADEFLRLYPVASDSDVPEMAKAAAREGGVLRTARNWAVAQNKSLSSPVFIYNLSRVHPFNPAQLASDRVDLIGAYHTSDVPYWFGTLEAFNIYRPMRLWQDDDRRMSETMTSMLIAFANTGNPSVAGMTWPAWSPENEQLIEFGQTAIEAKPIDGGRLDFIATTAGRWPAPPPRNVAVRD